MLISTLLKHLCTVLFLLLLQSCWSRRNLFDNVTRFMEVQGEDDAIPQVPIRVTKHNVRSQDDDTPPSPGNETWCICSKIYDPVCANNGRSYYNVCQFECAVSNSKNDSLKIEHQGNCIPF